MRIKRYDITVSLLNSFFKAGRRDIEVSKNALPEDAVLVKIFVDPKVVTPDVVTLFYVHPSFPESAEGSIPDGETILYREYSHVDLIKDAIRDFHYALDLREHGGIAAMTAIDRIQEILKIPWAQGEEKKRRNDE